jgi:hypothetical protein
MTRTIDITCDDLRTAGTRTFKEETETITTILIPGVLTEITHVISTIIEITVRHCEDKCHFALVPNAAAFSAAGGTGSFDLTVERDCKWSLVLTPDWLVITSNASGQGNGTVNFTVKPNPANTARGATIHVLGDGALLSLFVTQAANPLKVSLSDPAACFTAGGNIGITAYLNNDSASPVSASFTASLPPQLLGVAGSCSSTVGFCAATTTSITWSGMLAPGQSVPINYQAQLAPTTPNGAMLVINNAVSFNGGAAIPLAYEFTPTCPNAATLKPQFCGAASFTVPLLTQGLATNAAPDLFALPQPLTLTIVSSERGGQSFTVNAETFGSQLVNSCAGLLNATTQGLRLNTPNALIRALFCADSFRSVSFELGSTGAPGDVVRLFRQNPDGSGAQELASFTVRSDGQSVAVTQLHAQAALLLGNRLAAGAGQLAANAVLPLSVMAGASGRRTGLLTLALGDGLEGCFQLGVDLSRGSGTGTLALVLTDALVKRQPQAGDNSKQATGLFGSTGSFPTGLMCRVACPACPSSTKPNDCAAGCWHSPQYYLLHLDDLPGGAVTIWGVNFNAPVSTDNTTALKQVLQGGTSALQQLNRGYVTAQLNLLRAGGGAGLALHSRCSCRGVSFAPVVLSNGFILTPNTTLGELLEQARRALAEHKEEDMAQLAAVFELLNGNGLLGRLGCSVLAARPSQ